MRNQNAWDWEEIGKELEETCEHCTGITVLQIGRFSITRCTWWCKGWLFRWLGWDGITRTIREWS